MQNKKTYIWNILFMLVLLGVSFYVLLKDQDLPAIAEELRGADKGQMSLAMFAAILYLILQSISLVVILESGEHPDSRQRRPLISLLPVPGMKQLPMFTYQSCF